MCVNCWKFEYAVWFEYHQWNMSTNIHESGKKISIVNVYLAWANESVVSQDFCLRMSHLYTPVRHIVFDKEKQPTLNLLLARFYPPSYLKLSLKIRSTNKWRRFSGNRHMGVEKTKGVVLEKKIQRTKKSRSPRTTANLITACIENFHQRYFD